MAYTITQKPTTPNAAYTRLLYVVSGSSNTSKPQFQYVMDVYESGSSSRIYRTTQTINPAGVAVFDPSRVMQGELVDEYSWKISSVTPFDSSSKTFRLEFGEQYASSISSSVSVVDNIERTNTEVFRGVVEPNSGYFNWQSSSYAVLSNMPATMSMQNNDNGTIGIYNNDVSYISQSYFATNKYSGSTTIEKNYNVNDNFVSVPITASGFNWGYADVEISSSIGLQKYRYENSTDGNREKTRFAFINKLGTWDYYNNYNPVRQAIDITREQYTAPRVDYSSLTSVYDIERRGRTDIHNTTDDTFVVDTDLLNKTNANWIEELIESPSVYIQRNGEFIPIIITDSSYVANQNQARQKQFKYTITFKPSNQPFGKWEPEFVTCPLITPLGTFDPYAGGTISTASLLHWYDFSDSSTMKMSYGTSNIYSIESKGFYTASLTTGSKTLTNKYSPGVWIAPTFETQESGVGIPSYTYTQFYGSPLPRNSTLASAYGDFDSSSIFPGFSGSDSTTTILFAFPDLDEIGTNDNLITYLEPTVESRGGLKDLKILATRNAVNANFKPIFYSANTASIRNVGSQMDTELLNQTGSMYSYSGSSNGWQSVYLKISGSVPAGLATANSVSGSVSSSRAIGETVASWESLHNIGGIVNNEGEGLSVGGNAKTNDRDSSPFKLTNLLVYSGSLTDSQIDSIIESYKASVPFGDQINSISN